MQSEPNTSESPFKIDVADRVKRLPPYLFGKINALKYEKRGAGVSDPRLRRRACQRQRHQPRLHAAGSVSEQHRDDRRTSLSAAESADTQLSAQSDDDRRGEGFFRRCGQAREEIWVHGDS